MKEERRKSKLSVTHPGGNAGPLSKKYRVSLPNKWITAMGLSPEKRSVVLTFNGSEISIKRAEDMDEDQKERREEEPEDGR